MSRNSPWVGCAPVGCAPGIPLVPVLTPTGRVHFIGWESSKCAVGRAASIFDRGREYAERLAGKHVLYLEFGVNRLYAVDPKGHELASKGHPSLGGRPYEPRRPPMPARQCCQRFGCDTESKVTVTPGGKQSRLQVPLEQERLAQQMCLI